MEGFAYHCHELKSEVPFDHELMMMVFQVHTGNTTYHLHPQLTLNHLLVASVSTVGAVNRAPYDVFIHFKFYTLLFLSLGSHLILR